MFLKTGRSLGRTATHLTPVAAYSFLTFNLLCAPCFAAIGAIRRNGRPQMDIRSHWLSMRFGLYGQFVIYQLGHVLVEKGTLTLGTF